LVFVSPRAARGGVLRIQVSTSPHFRKIVFTTTVFKTGKGHHGHGRGHRHDDD
jgi:hypothetical protein